MLHDAEAWFQRGLEALALSQSADHHSEYVGDHETAVNAFDEATRRAPDYAEAWLHKGLALAVLGRAEEALAAHLQVVRLRPDDPEARLHQAASLRALGRHAEALDALEQTLRRLPADADAWFLKMQTLGTLARGEEALAACEEVLRLETTEAATRCCAHNLIGLFVDRRLEAGLGKGSALARIGRRASARVCFADALRQSRDSLEGSVMKQFVVAFAGSENRHCVNQRPNTAYRPEALAGLSNADRAAIVNFVVPPQ